MRTGSLAALVCLATVLCGACRKGESETQGSPALLPVTLPDLSGVEQTVRAQIEASHSTLIARVAAPSTPASELGAAFGDFGKLLMAAEYNAAAEPCLLNAATVDAGSARWPYYLGHLFKREGDLARAASYFERTIALQPANATALWWLANVELDLGRYPEADTHFARALALQPDAWATMYGIGRTALNRKDYSRAVDYLERTLALNPGAAAAHYQLGLAYRGLGRMQDAEVQLRQRSDMEIRPASDPLIAELDALLQTPAVYQSRALEAGKAGMWSRAATNFRTAVELDPQNAAARLGLGVALFNAGHPADGLEQVKKALAISPQLPRAHYVLGTLLAMGNRDREAINPLAAAVALDGNFMEARISLAQALQRIGRDGEALAQYQQILTRVPGDSEGQFGCAITLVRLGRYQEARVQLGDGAAAHPGEQRFSHALARLLAAAPDDRVRDGMRAHALAEALFQTTPTIEGAETMAMAMAELGRFRDASEWQRRAIAAVEQERQTGLARRMGDTLALYERGTPCRVPWRPDDPIFSPRPPTSPGL